MLKRNSLIILTLLLGAGLRFHALAYDTRFHPDEALFATFARKAAVNGDWMLHGPLDKPPLSIYAEAISMMLVGARPLPNGVLTLDTRMGELAARVPGTLASIVLVSVMYALAKRLYWTNKRARRAVPLPVPIIAAFLMAVSPYALAFSATAFTDGLMLLCMVMALWMASRGQWFWAGLWMALGYACKQQALFYVPLVVGVGWNLTPWPPLHVMERGRTASIAIFKFALPIAICFGVLAVWDGARTQETSLWMLAVMNNDPGRLIYPEQALPRLQIWASYAGHFAGSWWMTAILGVIAVVGMMWRAKNWPQERSTRVDVILAVYVLGYGVIHWLVALPTHDRYLLPLVPLVILLMARGIETGIKSVTQWLKDTRAQRSSSFVLGIIICIAGLSFWPSAWDATEGRIGVGGDRGQHAGIDRLGAYLDSKPLGTIVYDHWLGWELGYYLGTWSDKRLTYYPTPDALAADAAAQDDRAPRYFPVPRNVPVDPWLTQLAQAGFMIARDFESRNFVVYRLMPPKS